MQTSATTAQGQLAVGPVSVRSKFRRSRSTSALHLLPHLDGNSSVGRRFADIALALAGELGGVAMLSEASKVQIRQAAALTIKIEAMQAGLIRGDDVDLEAYTRMSNALTRTLRALGVKRQVAQPTGVAAYLAKASPG